ncbi:hypothetical protein [Burkholderia phage vB_BpP_HN02]|uniref:Tail fiber protein n=1 Tax=Burkholderia phage vB_BpP_HN02 TaxID=3116925 RepID=A0AAX4JGZ0_9CAUD
MAEHLGELRPKDIELIENTANRTLDWRYLNQDGTKSDWQVLVPLVDITGQSPELRLNSQGMLQWKYTNEPDSQWRNIFDASGMFAQIDVLNSKVAALEKWQSDYSKIIRYPSQNVLGDSRVMFDILVPRQGNKWIDNVFSIQNLSTDGNWYGNAAIAFLDAAGIEKGAIGYSRNKAIQPGGYTPNTLYCEIGNPFSTDAEVTHFRVINTIKAGGPFWGGQAMSYTPMEVLGDTGDILFDAGGGGGAIRFQRGPVRFNTQYIDFGDINITGPAQLALSMGNTAFRIREHTVSDSVLLATNVQNMAGDDSNIIQDKVDRASWGIQFGHGSPTGLALDSFAVRRTAPGTKVMQTLMTVNNKGTIVSGTTATDGWTLSVDDGKKTHITVGNSITLPPGAGTITLNNYANGSMGVFAVSGGGAWQIWQSASDYLVGAPTAGKICIEAIGNTYKIHNRTASDIDLGILMMASRQTV